MITVLLHERRHHTESNLQTVLVDFMYKDVYMDIFLAEHALTTIRLLRIRICQTTKASWDICQCMCFLFTCILLYKHINNITEYGIDLRKLTELNFKYAFATQLPEARTLANREHF